MDSIRPVRATRNDPVQEADSLSIFEHLDALVAHPREPCREGRQLVVVRREQSAAAELR
jgi:hypothetical protein